MPIENTDRLAGKGWIVVDDPVCPPAGFSRQTSTRQPAPDPL